MSVAKAADGIYQVINANMAAALSVVSVQRGYDPREFVLIVAGGAGPIHAAPIARDLEIPLVLIPRESSVFCAAGMLISDLKHDYVRTYARDLDKVVVREVTQLYKEMTDTALATLRAEGVARAKIVVGYSADLRYVGQFNEVEVPVTGNGTVRNADLAQLVDQFHARHDTLYGYSMQGTPVELINLRVTGRGLTPKPRFERFRPARDGGRKDPDRQAQGMVRRRVSRGPGLRRAGAAEWAYDTRAGDHLAADDDDRRAAGLRSQVRRVQQLPDVPQGSKSQGRNQAATQ